MSIQLPPPTPHLMVSAIPPEAIRNVQKSAPIHLQIQVESIKFKANDCSLKARVNKIIRNHSIYQIKSDEQIQISINPKHLINPASNTTPNLPMTIGAHKGYNKPLKAGITTHVWIKPTDIGASAFEVAAGVHSFGPDYEQLNPVFP